MRAFSIPPPSLPTPAPLSPIHQTPGDNQCLRCCAATIFSLPPNEVPFFGGNLAFDPQSRDDGSFGALQQREFRDWLRGRGLEAVQTYQYLGDKKYFPNPRPWGLSIANGPTERGTYHSVVWDAGFWDYPRRAGAPEGQPDLGHMLHDPHPSGAGLQRVDSWYCFAVMDPRRLA